MEDTDEDEDADGEGPSKKRSKFIDDMAAIGEDDEDLEDFDMEDPFLRGEEAGGSPPPPPSPSCSSPKASAVSDLPIPAPSILAAVNEGGRGESHQHEQDVQADGHEG